MTKHNQNPQADIARVGNRERVPGLRAAALLLLFGVTAAAQTDPFLNPPVPSPATGIYLTGANTLGGIESVNTVNGNVTLTFPLAQLPPDNVSLGAGVSLIYNSAVYDAPAIPVSTTQADLMYTASAHGGGWNYGYEYKLWAQPRIPLVNMSAAVCGLLSTAEQTYWYKNFLQTPDGTNHILYRVDAIPPANGPTDDPAGTGFLSTDFAGFGNPNTSYCGTSQQQYTGVLVFATVDGSDIRVETTTAPAGTGTWIAWLPNGTQISGNIGFGDGVHYGEDSPADLITDRNGNKVFVYGTCTTGAACEETISDVPGRMITVTFASRSGSWTDTIAWHGPNGAINAYVNSSLTPMSGISYQCGSTTSGWVNGSYCPLSTSLWQVTSIQMPPAVTSGNQTTFAFGYTPAAGNQNWGEAHTLQKCVGVGLTTCSTPQWTVKYNYLFDPASPLRPPGVTINPILNRTLTYTETLDTVGTSPLSEMTTYSIWYPPNSVYKLYGGEPISPANTIKNPDGGTTTISLSSLCATGTVARDTCAPVVYQAQLPDNSWRKMAYGWTTSYPLGIPSGTLVNPYIAIAAETRPNPATAARGTLSPQDVNGNITNVTRYDWGATITPTSGLVVSISGTALQSSVIAYNEQTTGAVYWNPHTETQPNLRAVTSVAPNGTTLATYLYDNATTTANLTQLKLWDSGLSFWISQFQSYNANGNVASQTDGNNNITAICYDSNNLYPATVVVAAAAASCPTPAETTVGRTSTYTSEFFSGVQLSATDADNNVTTNGLTYDNLARQLTATQSGSGGLTRTATTTYDDVGLEISTTQSDTTTNSLTNMTYYDPLGRVRLTVDGAGNRIESAYRYGSGYRYQLQSTPYTGGSATGWTLTTMDTVGRVTEVDHYSGSTPPMPWGSNTSKTGTATYAYDQTLSGCTGPATSATDEAGNTKYTCSDGLDRLVSVTEPNASTGGTGTVTTYGYDSLSNLSTVDAASGGTQQPTLSCGHMRCFTYSTLSRLLTASNPESGTTTWTYDSNGNLGTRTDGNGTKMTVGGYDGLNRPFLSGNPSVTYATVSPAVATNAVTYAYDHLFKGSLWSVTNTTSSTSYTYDGFGRINASTQTTGTNGPYTFAYGYSLTDQLTSMTYPSGRQVNYALDAADRVITVQNVTGGGNYAGSIGYTPDGGLTGMALGNGVTQSYTWNDRLQPTGLTVMGATTTLLQLGFYPCATNGTACASGNNGNLQSQTIAMPGLNLTQAYSYDHLNRLASATESGGGANWTQGYGYDVLGNRWVTTNTNLPNLTLETPVAQSWYSTTVPNRYASSTGWTYDYAGNVLTVGGVARSFTYDGENRQVTACINCAPGSPTATYAYDGNGQRVSKTTGGQTTTYVYDAGGNLAAEYATAAVTSPCGTQTCYVTTDHLGSTRMLTSSAGAVGTRYDYQPFGQEILAGYDGRLTSMGYLSLPDATNPKYTGQERDPETADPTTPSSGLDWFNVRYLDSFQGRFQSPDPGNAGADPTNPQTWNGFAYVGNNPLSYTDPSGMEAIGAGTAAGCGLGPEGCAIGAAIGAAVDLGALLYGILGGGPSTIPPALATPSSPILGSGSQGGVFGGGNTSPFVFSAMGTGQGLAWWDLPGQWFVGFGDLVFNNKPSGAARMAYAVGGELAMGAAVGRVAGAIEARLSAGALRQYVDISNLSDKIVKQMSSRGWTTREILDTVENGRQYNVVNKATGGRAIEYVNPTTGKFIVIDDATKQVLQVSGPAHLPNHLIQ